MPIPSHARPAVVLGAVLVGLFPFSANAATVLSELAADLGVATSFSGGRFTSVEDFDEASVLIDGLQTVEAFVPGGPLRIEGFASSPGFASATGDASGNFGVGVNSLFLSPPNPNAVSIASGFFAQDILNDSGATLTLDTSVFIPAPVIRLAGQITDLAPGPVPVSIPSAEVGALITAAIRRLDGSLETSVLLDYGMRVARDPATGLFTPTLSPDARTLIVDAQPFDFRYELAELDETFEDFAVLAPGESVSLRFDYFARASNGVGETGYLAAIGDPFDIAGSGGLFGFAASDSLSPPPPPPPPPPPSAVPLPSGLPLLASAIAGLAWASRRRRFGMGR